MAHPPEPRPCTGWELTRRALRLCRGRGSDGRAGGRQRGEGAGTAAGSVLGRPDRLAPGPGRPRVDGGDPDPGDDGGRADGAVDRNASRNGERLTPGSREQRLTRARRRRGVGARAIREDDSTAVEIPGVKRSEEHTSEFQSHSLISYAVF